MSIRARRILRKLQHHELGFDARPLPETTGVLSPDRPNSGRFVPFVNGEYQLRRFADI
jgi:hypothetical protein